jgi:hypothetical protein
MQADRDARPFDPASPPDAVREYEARRCHICQARHPAFGFGPPLTRPGMVLWPAVRIVPRWMACWPDHPAQRPQPIGNPPCCSVPRHRNARTGVTGQAA